MMQKVIYKVFLSLVMLSLPLTVQAAKMTKGGGQAKAQEERSAPAQFDLSSSDGVDMSVRADRKRDEAIAKLKKLMGTIPEGGQKAELIFRLAEMYWAKSKFLHLRGMQVWDEALDGWHKGGSKGRQPKLEDMAELKQSGLYRREALKLYGKILSKYRKYPRKDEVLYTLGTAHYEAGQKKKGVRYYWKLIKQFPRSVYVADAWLQLGEHFFNANKLSNAIKAYKKAAKTKKARIYSFALYKLAWCDYNLQEYGKALEKFRQVIAYAKKQSSSGGKGKLGKRDRIQLMSESLSDMVRTYSHLDAVDEAFTFYEEEVGAKRSYKYLHRLAGLYNREGKSALEIQTFKKLNDKAPYAAEAPQNQTAIMGAYARLGRTDEVRREVRRLIDLYSPNGIWAQKNAGNNRILESAFEVVEQELAALVTEQHRDAQRTKDVATYKLARDIYKEYLDKFQDSVNSYKFRFFYSEILFELKQFDEAAVQYTMVINANKKGEFATPAAYTAVLALEKVVSGVKETLGKKIRESKKGRSKGALKELEKLKVLKKGQSYAEKQLDANELRLAEAYDRFVEVAPKDAEVVKVKFKSARLYYIHNQFEKAAERFGEVIDRWPNDKLARLGAESILQSFNVREDWSQLNQWSRKFKGNATLSADKAFKKKVSELVEGASFNEILYVFEPKSSPMEIADYYNGFVTEFPKSKYAMVGLYNTLINYDKAGALQKAIDSSEKLLNEYATFKISKEEIKKTKKEGTSLPEPDLLREKTLFLAASFYERFAEFERSAKYYESYAKQFKKGPKRADALFNAGLFREGLGQYTEAIIDFDTYIRDFPKKEDALDILWRIGLIHEKQKSYSVVVKHYDIFKSKVKSTDPARYICAEYKIAKAKVELGRADSGTWTNLVKLYQALPDDKKTDVCALDAVGQAAFVLLEGDYDSYMAIKLTGSEKQITKNLMDKLKRVEELQGKYTQVLQLGQGDYGIASLYRIGSIYQDLANELFEAPCPSRLTEDQCIIYQAALQEKGFPLEEKAIEAYDNALTKAYDLGLYNDWLQKTQEALAVYEPGRFPEIHKFELIADESLFDSPELVEMR